eukprot:GILI01018237.1.p1 GENE.GILI01018237.1~~GILI01018237.1.p1  ORF type:complete len:355 (+),score=44.60 GILI01018237.1:58-1122(+)
MPVKNNNSSALCGYQNLFVAKIPHSVSDSELRQVFQRFSPESATVMLDPVTGRSKGFGFIAFPSDADGLKAFETMNKATAIIANRAQGPLSFEIILLPSKHSRKEVARENECLYIRNIPNTWPMAEVETFIAKHGQPVYSAVRKDRLGSPVWVVFVQYDSVESARNTLKAIHGTKIAASGPPILAKFAEGSEVKDNRRNRKHSSKSHHRKDDHDGDDAAPLCEPTSQLRNVVHSTRYQLSSTAATPERKESSPPICPRSVSSTMSPCALSSSSATSAISTPRTASVSVNREVVSAVSNTTVDSEFNANQIFFGRQEQQQAMPSYVGRRFRYNPYSLESIVVIESFPSKSNCLSW